MVLYTADGRRELQIHALKYETILVSLSDEPCSVASTEAFVDKAVRANAVCCSAKAAASTQ